MRFRTPLVLGVAAAAVCTYAVSASAVSGIVYMEAVAAGVTMKPLLTTGDVVGDYVWPGTPDGIGVLRDGKNLTVFLNHELATSNKTAAALQHANGSTASSTVTALNFDIASQTITGGADAIKLANWFDYTTGQRSAVPVAPSGADAKDAYGGTLHGKGLNRFCSSNMVQPGGLSYTDASGVVYGFTGPAYFTGEENGDESRGFVLDTSGNLIQLPKLGLAGWENFLTAPKTGMNTVVIGNEDNNATDSQLWMYVGTKTKEGTWVDRAGLTNGQAYVMAVDGIANDNALRASKAKGVETAVSFKAIDTSVNGKAQNLQALSLGTEMSRVEDGAWDPANPNDYYFVTTESNKDAKATAVNPAEPTFTRDGGGLWRLRFADVKNPLAGGATLTMLLDGSEAPYLSKPDNIEVGPNGNIMIQEDPGNNGHVARVVSYRISDGKLGVVAKFVDAYFKVGAPGFLTQDEESSGITDVTSYLKSSAADTNTYYLLDAQVHTATGSASRPDLNLSAADKAIFDSKTIEGGQLLLMTIPQSSWAAIYS